MKLSVKTSQGGGLFGGLPSSEVTIEGQDYEAAPAVVAARMILAQNGIGEMPSVDDEDEATLTGDKEDAPDDDVPAAGWKTDDQSASDTPRESKPGDAVRIVWEGDQSSRMFIDSGTQWVSPAVAGVFSEPMSVEYGTSDIRVYVVASQPERGVKIETI